MKNITKLLLLSIVFITIACNQEPTLQKYYVEHQDDENFVVLDVPSSLFLRENSSLSNEDQKAIKSIKKANVLVLPVNGENKEIFKSEKATMETILKDEKYKTLMRFGSSGRNVKVMYLGEEKAIDEVIVYANDDSKGFAVARLLGDNMDFSAIMRLMKSASEGDVNVNLDFLEGFGKEVNEKSGNPKLDTDSISKQIKMNINVESKDSI
jgi:hypothetical protein